MTNSKQDSMFGPKPGSFDWLSDRAKEHALDKLRDINVDHDWWDYTYEDAMECGRRMGIEIDKIFFSGFWSQGDGACFEGHYAHLKGARQKLREHAPRDKELSVIMRDINLAQRDHGYKLTATMKQRGHYYHSGCMDVDVYDKDGMELGTEGHALRDALRAFADWIYKQLENEHDYLTKDETIIETIEANEYQFDEEGDLL